MWDGVKILDILETEVQKAKIKIVTISSYIYFV